MILQEIHLPQNHQVVMDRFVTACQEDERVAAAFLYGSYAAGTADRYSDLDLFLITSDEAYADFLASRETFMRLLGEPLFLEDFGRPDILLSILSGGTECELSVGSESRFHHIYAGPYHVLLDKKGILANAVFPRHEADQAAQIKLLRQQVTWFWHVLSLFIKAMGRGQLWFAYGELEVLRQMCVNLARLRYNFSDDWAGEEPYFKVEQVLPVEQLSPLQATCCPMEYEAMLQAGLVIFNFYQDVAPALARSHGIAYPVELESLMADHLEKLANG
jgi:predicted nucleotidyltransferase